MRRSRIWIALCLAAGAVWLTGPGPARAQGYDDWNPDMAGFPSSLADSPRANCAGRSDQCIDRTIGEMWRRFHVEVPTCDHNAIFSLTYLRVTEAIRAALHEGFYPDEDWLDYQDAIFARIYFLAYDNWRSGRTHLVPTSWRMAFDAALDKQVEGIGNLLMAMNAHINRDFPFILYHAGLANPDGSSKKPEHDSGNEILRELYKPMLAELARRFDETIDDYDVPGLFADDEAFFEILVGWRETTWQNAQRLADAGSDAERRAVARDIESYANAQAELIFNGAAYGPGDEVERAARESRCAQFGGQRKGYPRGGDVASPFGNARLRGRMLRVGVRCPHGPGPCRGAVKVRVPRSAGGATASGRFRLAGRERFGVGVDRSRRLRINLDRGSARALRAHPRRGVWVAVRSKLGPGDGVTERIKARLRT